MMLRNIMEVLAFLFWMATSSNVSAWLVPLAVRHDRSVGRLFSTRNNGWDASNYERYAPQRRYDEPEMQDTDYMYSPHEQEYYNGQPPAYPHDTRRDSMEPPYDMNGTPPPNGEHYQYGDQQPQDYPYEQDYYDGNGNYRDPTFQGYRDLGNAYDTRNQNPPQMEGNEPYYSSPSSQANSNSELVPFESDPYAGEYLNDNQRYDELERQPLMTRRPRDLFDQVFEEADRVFDSFGMLSPFSLSPFSLSPFSLSPFRRRRSLLPSPWMDFFPPWSNDMRSMMARQTDSIQPLLDEAERYLNEDEACTTALGSPIQMGPVFSQSSSSSSFNGQTRQSRTNLQVSVQGSTRQGTLRLYATEEGIEQMVLQVEDDDREINVYIPKGEGRATAIPENDSNIVDAEIISENNHPAELMPAETLPEKWTTKV